MANIDGAPQRMMRMDSILGMERLLAFAETISDLLVHTESAGAGLARLGAADGTDAIVCAYVIIAATEFEAAWNMLRLANVPGAFRQSRVGAEAVAGATMLALPMSYLDHLPEGNPVTRALQEHPDTTLERLMAPSLVEADGITEYVPAPLRATQVYRAFTMLLKVVAGIDTAQRESLQQFREDVQHPASHGSRDLMAYHFQGFGQDQTLRAGAYIDETRYGTYRLAADSIIELIRNLNAIGLRVSAHVRDRA